MLHELKLANKFSALRVLRAGPAASRAQPSRAPALLHRSQMSKRRLFQAGFLKNGKNEIHLDAFFLRETTQGPEDIGNS